MNVLNLCLILGCEFESGLLKALSEKIEDCCCKKMYKID